MALICEELHNFNRTDNDIYVDPSSCWQDKKKKNTDSISCRRLRYHQKRSAIGMTASKNGAPVVELCEVLETIHWILELNTTWKGYMPFKKKLTKCLSNRKKKWIRWLIGWLVDFLQLINSCKLFNAKMSLKTR